MLKNKKFKRFIKSLNVFLVFSGLAFWYLIITDYFEVDRDYVINLAVEYFDEYQVKSDGVSLSKCVDGDTAWFYIDGIETKVRFLYVDTPESTNEIEAYGKEASEFTCNALTEADSIRLEYDGDVTDKYGRTLSWIFITKDGEEVLLQQELAENGYVKKIYDYGDYRYEQLILDSINDKYNIYEE